MNGKDSKFIFSIALKSITAILAVVSIFSSWKMFENEASRNLGLFFLIISVLITVGLIAVGILFTNYVNKQIAKLSTDISKTERDSLINFPAPVVIVNGNYEIIWFNKSFFANVYCEDDPYAKKITDIFNINLQDTYSEKGDVVSLKKHFYRVKAVHTEYSGELDMIYFNDITDYIELDYEYRQSRNSVVLITVDNYDELLNNSKESEKAHILVDIERLIENFLENTTGIVRKSDADQFFIVLEQRYLLKIIEGRFKILEQARAIKISEKHNITLSIGVGANSNNLAESFQNAKQALDMCLGRGGDQAAVKTENGFEFYGGVSGGYEKHNKVRVRMFANALKELCLSHTDVLIMGHRFGDLDSVGSATGLCAAVRSMGRECHVVVDMQRNLAQKLISHVQEKETSDFYISPETAMEFLKPTTLLIIVDTHNPDLVESQQIFRNAADRAIIDHHRLASDQAKSSSLLLYHEPNASSACEMVAEVIEYLEKEVKISSCHAEAMLAGIMLDTKNFIMRTGVRTFEAAAFLKRLGADTVAVKGMFANSIETYRMKSALINASQVYHKCAVSLTSEQGGDIRISAAQAADEMLGIDGVKAAFTLYMTGDIVNISARSLGDYNVQIIMESLGGGGHQTMAAAQLKTDLEQARKLLLEAIDEYIIQNK